MEKIIKLSLIIMLIMICFTGAVHAAESNCNITLETSKSEFSKNDEFSVDVKISNIQSERGFIALEAALDYDKESLTLVSMAGQNDWSKPVKDLSYNESTGKFVIDKNGLAKSDEVILRLQFKVNENSKQNVRVALKNIKISDAISPVRIDIAYKDITIKEGNNNQEPTPNPTPTPTPTPNPEPTPTPDSKPTQNPNSKPSTSTSKTETPTVNNYNNSNEKKPTVKIPQAGETNTVFIVLGAIAIIGGVFCLIKINLINRKIKK